MDLGLDGRQGISNDVSCLTMQTWLVGAWFPSPTPISNRGGVIIIRTKRRRPLTLQTGGFQHGRMETRKVGQSLREARFCSSLLFLFSTRQQNTVANTTAVSKTLPAVQRTTMEALGLRYGDGSGGATITRQRYVTQCLLSFLART